MVIVNKILNVLIFLLAIAACIAAILLHQRRIELRGRADYLAKIVAETAEKIDGGEKTSSDINASGEINKEALTWEAYHKSRELKGDEYVFTTWKDKLDKLPQHTETLFALKVRMASKFLEIQEAAQLDLSKLKNEAGEDIENDGQAYTSEEYKMALNSYTSFDDMVWSIPDKIKKVNSRGLVLADQVIAIAAALKKEKELTDFNIFSDGDNAENTELKGSLEAIANDANALYTRNQLIAKGYADIIKGFDPDQNFKDRYFTPKFQPGDMLDEDQGILSGAIATLTRDLKDVNKLLHERVVTLDLLEKARTDIARKDTTIEELNNESDILKNENGRIKAKNVRVSKQLEELKILLGNNKNFMAPGFTAQVVEANERFDFIVLNKGKKDGVKNKVEMVIHNNGQFICKVLVTKVLENSCVCDILPVTRLKNAEGKAVLPSMGDEAVVPGL